LRVVALLGASFLALSLLALSSPQAAQIPLLGAGFGGLHVLFGFWIGRAAHAR
jgi:hypothetical protein